MPLFFQDGLYEGYIKAKGRRYFIRVITEDPQKWDVETLIIDWRLQSLLHNLLNEFIEANSNNVSFSEFFSRLESFVQSSLTNEEDMWFNNPQKAFNLYKSLEKDLQDVGDLIKDVNADEGFIQIESMDLALRTHKAVLKYTENYPNESIEIVSHDLPLNDENFFENCEIHTISQFCQKFVQCIDAFQDFWNTVSILDSKCWVIIIKNIKDLALDSLKSYVSFEYTWSLIQILDPENPTFKDTSRRIKISKRVSVILVLNPYKSKHRPEMTFVGCHSTVTEFREILQRNLENEVWNPELDILSNLMNVLDVTFPQKTNMSTEEDPFNLIQTGECVICFQLRLDDEMPSVICDNSNCLSHYHAGCLSRYLRAIPKNTYLFGRIQGECPNCNEIIFCPFKN